MDTQQAAPSPLSLNPPEMKGRAGDLVSGLASEDAGPNREPPEAERSEMWPFAPDSQPRTLGDPDHSFDGQADVGQVMWIRSASRNDSC